MQCWYGEDMDEDCRIGSTHPNIPPDKHAAYPGDGAEPQEEGA